MSNDYAAIPSPTKDNLLDCVNALKQTLEALIGLRGTPASTAVTGEVSSILKLQGDIAGLGDGVIDTIIQPHAVGLADMAQIAAGRILGNPTGATADVQAAALTAYLDLLSSAQGTMLFRGATGWSALAPGTAGNFLQTQGAGADPIFTPIVIPSPPWTLVTKPTDQSCSTTAGATSAVVDPALTFNMAANTRYRVRVRYDMIAGSVGFFIGTSGPASPTSVLSTGGMYWSTNSGASQGPAMGVPGSPAYGQVFGNVPTYPAAGAMFEIFVSNGATAGPFNLKVGGVQAGTATVFKAGSYLEYTVVP